MGGARGVGREQMQVLTTSLPHKRWEWQKLDGVPALQRSLQHKTPFMASFDIETAFAVARPTVIAQVLEKTNVHGWITAMLEETKDLTRVAEFAS